MVSSKRLANCSSATRSPIRTGIGFGYAGTDVAGYKRNNSDSSWWGIPGTWVDVVNEDWWYVCHLPADGDLDGSLVGTKTGVSYTPPAGGQVLNIGRRSSNENLYRGKIDNVVYFPKSLSGAEVLSLFGASCQ